MRFDPDGPSPPNPWARWGHPQFLNPEPERVAAYGVAITDIKRTPRLINVMAATEEKTGMSPFKF